jgi:hypothetical protein
LDGVSVPVGVGELEGVMEAVPVPVTEGVLDGVSVPVGVGELLGVSDAVPVPVTEGVLDGVSVPVGVGELLGVWEELIEDSRHWPSGNIHCVPITDPPWGHV